MIVRGLLIVLLLLAFVVQASAVAIQRIYLGNVDSTPPATPAFPTSGSLLSVAAVEMFTEVGSFFGIDSGITGRSSPTGVTWTNLTTPSGTYSAASHGVGVIGSRWVQALQQTGTNRCVVAYSDDTGSSWTPIQIDGANASFCGDTTFGRTLLCNASRCMATSKDTNNSVTNIQRIYTSTDGATWGASLTLNGSQCNGVTCVGILGEFSVVYASSTYCLAVMAPTTGTSNSGLLAFVSSNGGATWSNGFQVTTTINSMSGWSGTKFGNKFYIYGNKNSLANKHTVWESSDLTASSWSVVTPVYTPTISNNVVFSAIQGFDDYTNPTLTIGMLNSLDAPTGTKVYTSEDAVNFSQISGVSGNNGAPWGFRQASDNAVYFGTSSFRFYKLS